MTGARHPCPNCRRMARTSDTGRPLCARCQIDWPGVLAADYLIRRLHP